MVSLNMHSKNSRNTVVVQLLIWVSVLNIVTLC